MLSLVLILLSVAVESLRKSLGRARFLSVISSAEPDDSAASNPKPTADEDLLTENRKGEETKHPEDSECKQFTVEIESERNSTEMESTENGVTEHTEPNANDVANLEASKPILTEIEDSANINSSEQATGEFEVLPLPEEVLRKTSLLEAREIKPETIQLRTYEKRIDVFPEDASKNMVHDITEELNEEDSLPDIKADLMTFSDHSEDFTLPDVSFYSSFEKNICHDIREEFKDDPSKFQRFLDTSDDGEDSPILEDFLAPSAASSASTRCYPGYQHLSERHQKQKLMVGFVENLLDDVIGSIPQLSSSGATSLLTFSDNPEDFNPSFNSSFENNEF